MSPIKAEFHSDIYKLFCLSKEVISRHHNLVYLK